MKPRVTVITLGVDDLAKAVAFYRDGLGWPTQGIIGKECSGCELFCCLIQQVIKGRAIFVQAQFVIDRRDPRSNAKIIFGEVD